MTSHEADSLARMLMAVLIALAIGTVTAFGSPFFGRVEREAIAASPATAPAFRHTTSAKQQSLVPMGPGIASMLLYSVLHSHGR